MEILSYPIGLLVGLFPIAVSLGPSQAPAHLLLDSRPVCEVTARSPGCMVDLGRDPGVHLLELVRTDTAGRVTERVRRWINRPGIEPEILAAVACDEAKKRCDFSLTWAHPDRLEPTRIDLSLDGRSVWHGRDRKASVPLAAGSRPQVLVADAVFPDGSRATYTRTLYAFNPEEVQAALQAVPIVPAPGSGSDEALAARLREAGLPVRIVEETEPAITFVLEPAVFAKLTGGGSNEPLRPPAVIEAPGDYRGAPNRQQQMGRSARPLRPGIPTSSPAGSLLKEAPANVIVPDETLSTFATTTRTLGRTRPFAASHWTRIADAVAAAGYALGGSPRRRAVVLVLARGDLPDVSTFSAAQARAYLSQVMVPLVVWRIGSDDFAREWPAGHVLTTVEDRQAALQNLRADLDRQRIAWIEGARDTRGAAIFLAPGIALGGRGAPTAPEARAAAASPRAEGPLPSTGPDGGSVHAVASAADGSVVYAGTHAGVFRSRDGGVRWEVASAGLPGAPVRCLAVEPDRPDAVFAGTDSGLFLTEDGGALWRSSGAGLPVTALALESGSPATLFVGTSGRGVHRSDDGGQTLLATALDHGDVRALAIDPLGRSVWAATEDGLFRTADRGSRWTPAGAFGRVLALAFDARGAALYAATAGDGLFVTTDDGATWKRTALANAYLTSVLAAGPGGGLLAGSPDGIFTSSGARWTLSRVGSIESLAAIRADAWIAGGPSGTLRADSSRQWVESNTGLTARSVFALASATGSALPLLAATPSGLLGRSPGGRWILLPGVPPGSAWYSVALGGSPAPELIVGSSGEIGRSFGLGEGWSWLPTAAVFGLAAPPGSPGLTLAATRGGILRSLDGGLSWKNASDGMARTFALQFAVDAVDPTIVYAATAGAGVFRSSNGGESWKAGGHDLARAIVRSLAPGVGARNVVYAGTDGGVFGSVTGGRTWTALVDGLPRGPVYALAGDPAAPLTLYAGTAEGLFVTLDAGKRWNPVSNASIAAPITALSLDSERRILHVATLGAGVFDVPLGP